MNLFVPWLADAARSTGYRVVEISGWRSRGHGSMRLVEGVVGHHTATPASAGGDYPSLGIVTNGRSDLAGPLCNLGLGRDGTIYVVAAGCAWHAGASRWAGFTDLNDEFLGIEAESPGHGEWTAAQRDCYPKLVGALLKYMNRGTDRYAGHKDVCVPVGRKPDPVGIDTAWLRGQAAVFMSGGASGGGGGGAPAAPVFKFEENEMDLQAGANLSRSFDIPAGATQLRVNCPEGQVTVHALYFAGDGLPPDNDANPSTSPPFDGKPGGLMPEDPDKTIDRLRPWRPGIPAGATNGSIFWTMDPLHPERTGSLSFR